MKFVGLWAGFLISSAQAESAFQTYSLAVPEGLYVYASAGQIASSALNDSSSTGGLGLGLRPAPWLAIEGDYMLAGRLEEGRDVLDSRFTGLSALLLAPMAPKWEGYFRLGFVRWRLQAQGHSGPFILRANESGSGPSLGIGAQWNGEGSLAARLELRQIYKVGGPIINEMTISRAAISVLFRF